MGRVRLAGARADGGRRSAAVAATAATLVASAVRPGGRFFRGDRAALLFVIGAAALLRSARIAALEITADEAFSWSMIQYPAKDLLRRLTDDAHPPLHYLLLKGWAATFGDSLASLRGLSVLLSCVTVLAIDRLVGLVRAGSAPEPAGGPSERANWCGVLAAALLAVSPLQTEASALGRMYALGACLSAVNAALFLSLVRAPRGRPLAWGAYVATTAAFALTHYYAFFSLLAPVVAVAWLAARRQAPPLLAGRFTLAWFAAALLYLPWLPSHLAQLRSVLAGFWIPELTRAEATRMALHYVSGLRVRDAWLDAVSVATACAALGVLAMRIDIGRVLIVALVLLPWAGGIAFSVLTGRTILLDRYLVFSEQYYLAAVALAIAEAPGRAVRAVLAALALLCGLYGLLRDAESGHDRGRSVEPLAQSIARSSRPGQVIVAGELAMALRLHYYLERLGVRSPLRIAGAPTTVGGHRVYLATIQPGTWVDPRDLGALSYDWIWYVETDKGKLKEAPPGRRLARSEPFIAMFAPRMILHLYERTAPPR